jgi:hypothetical protein
MDWQLTYGDWIVTFFRKLVKFYIYVVEICCRILIVASFNRAHWQGSEASKEKRDGPNGQSLFRAGSVFVWFYVETSITARSTPSS